MLRSATIIICALTVVILQGCGNNNGDLGDGSSNQNTTNSVKLSTVTTEGNSTTTEVVTLYSVPLPADRLNQNFIGIAGNLSMTSNTNVFNEVLYTVAANLSGNCPANGTAYTMPDPSAPSPYQQIFIDYPNLLILQQYILKLPLSGTTESINNFELPTNLTAGIPVSNCVVAMVDWLGASSVQVNADLNFVFNESTQPPPTAVPTLLSTNGEFCFGQNWGCQGATVDDTQSFANVTVITQKSQLLSLAGNISDSSFDNTGNSNGGYGPPPTGQWSMKNDFILMRGGCSAFSNVIADEANGVYMPADYYSSAYLPKGSYQTLLSIPFSGTGQMPLETSVAQNFSNVILNAGDCLITLVGMSGNGAVDAENQVHAIVLPILE